MAPPNAPYDTKNRVETIIKRLSDDRLSYAQRYHFSSLASRYRFRDLWDAHSGDEKRVEIQLCEPRSVNTGLRRTVQPFNFVSRIFAGTLPRQDLYKALVQAKRSCGETTLGFSLPRFHQLIASRADSLKEKLGCERVCFSVNVEGGHVSFKAKAEE